MRKRVFFVGAFIVIALLFASPVAFAEEVRLDRDEIMSMKKELQEGIPVKEVLEKHGITMGQIRSMLTKSGGFEHAGKKLTNTQIASIATTLGLDVDSVQADVESGKTLQEILQDNSITQDQMRDAFQLHREERREKSETWRSMWKQRWQSFKEDKLFWNKKRP